MTHDPFDTQAAAYALGALDGEELAAFEAHLAQGCAQCEAALRESREALAGVAASAPRAVPPPEIRDTLMRRAGGLDAARPSPRALRRAWLRGAAIAAAAMVIGGFLTGMYVASRYEARLGQLARETSALREQLRRAEAALPTGARVYERVVGLLQDPATRVVALRGAGPAPESHGGAIFNDREGGYLFVAKLPPAPEGKAYELWTIAGGKPSPAGVFQVDAAGQASHPIAGGVGAVDVFAVTLEPAGGVPAPTGPIVLASSK
jgi:anti-sigma-K factor RskA